MGRKRLVNKFHHLPPLQRHNIRPETGPHSASWKAAIVLTRDDPGVDEKDGKNRGNSGRIRQVDIEGVEHD